MALVVAAVVVSPSPAGNALQFDGASFAAIPDAPSLGLDSLTVEAWVNIQDPAFATAAFVPYWSVPLLSKGANYGNYTLNAMHTGINVAELEYVHRTETGNFDCCGHVQIPLNTWTHVAATFDATTGTAKVY